MKVLFYNIINNESFDLAELISRINYYHVVGELTTEDREELIQAAREKAMEAYEINPKEEILAIQQKLVELERRIVVLEDNPSPSEEWPEFIQPTGAHDSYQIGDKVTYNNKHYICQVSNCVWSPDVYPAGWQEET